MSSGSAASPQIRIMRVITRLNIGGPAQHATFLAEHLNRGMFATSLIAGSLGRGEGDMSSLAASRGIHVTSVSALGNDRGLIGDVRALVQLYRLMRRVRPMVVHLHLLKARCLGGVAARLAGVPVVVETLHGHLLHGYYGPLKTRLILAAERFVGRWLADSVIVLSESQRRELLGWGIADPKKIRVVPLGLELQRILTAQKHTGGLRRELALGEDTLLIGAVGRLVPIKGYSVLLQAVRKVRDAGGGPLTLVIVGDGPLRQPLEAEAERLEIRHLVKFLGWRKDIEHVYADLDVFVQPSLNEGTPVALIEAMAASAAVVASRTGGVPDVVQEGCSGMLVPPGDASALAQAILTLWRDPDVRRRLGEEARHQVCSRYDIRELVAQLQELYVQLLANRAAVPTSSRFRKQTINPMGE